MNVLSSACATIGILCFSQFPILAQQNTFEKTFGGNGNDLGHGVVLTEDGNILITGAKTIQNDLYPDTYFAKISKSGEIIWENTFNTEFEAGGNEIVAAENGNYFIAGHVDVTGFDACDALFFMINENGDTLWTRTFGFEADDVAYACTKANNGGFISAGKVEIGGNSNAFVSKHSDSGELVWLKIFGGPEEDFATSVKQVENGYLVSGRKTTNNNSDFWLMKINNSGDVIWEKTYANDAKDFPYTLQITPDGGCLIAGKEDLGGGITSILLIRTDNTGNLIWKTKYGNHNQDFAKGIDRAANGDWIIGGSLYNVNNQSQDMMMMQVNDEGTISSVRFFGDELSQTGSGLCSDGEGGYLFIGSSENETLTNLDIFLLKTDESGIVNSIEENHSSHGMEITTYPNPCSDVLNFTISNNTGLMHFDLLNTEGNVVIHLENVKSQQFSIQTNNLTSGLYFYKVSNDNAQFASTGKIVVLK